MENGIEDRETIVVTPRDRTNGHSSSFSGSMDSTIWEHAPAVGKLLSEVEPERVAWLWPGRLPLGK